MVVRHLVRSIDIGFTRPPPQDSTEPRSNTFYSDSHFSLKNAVKNADNNANRIAFAPVYFQDSNSYGASDTWLWTLTDPGYVSDIAQDIALGVINSGTIPVAVSKYLMASNLEPPKTNDDRYSDRSILCKPIDKSNWDLSNEDNRANYINYINAMGHPNKSGAKEYERAIETVITNKGFNWLDPSSSNKDAESWFQKGKDLFNQSKYDESIQCFDEAIKLNRSYIDAWGYKTRSLAVQGKSDEAIQCLDEAIKLNPQSDKLLMAKGGILLLMGRYDETIQCSNDAIELNQSYLEARGLKGMALHLQGKYDEAIQCYDEGISINPQSAFLWEAKGMTLDAQKRYDEAIQCYNEALKINPQNDEVWLNKGNVFSDQGNYDEAIQCYDEAIKIDPQEGFYWNNKGEALQKSGRSTEANEAFDKVRELGGIKGQTVGYGQERLQMPRLTDLTAELSSKKQSTHPTEETQDTSVDAPLETSAIVPN
jgi:tetratricopeptide (TPR) repeat protein